MPDRGTAHDPYLSMLRGACRPTLAVGLVCVAVAWFTTALPGALGALIAVLTVVLFFGSSLLVMSRTARIAPINVMALGVLTYVTKVGLLALLFVLLNDVTWMSGRAFALTALVCAAVWMPMEIWAFGRARVLVYDEPPAGTSVDA